MNELVYIILQRLERGENLNDEDGFGSTGDARDSISWLDRSVAVRVSIEGGQGGSGGSSVDGKDCRLRQYLMVRWYLSCQSKEVK